MIGFGFLFALANLSASDVPRSPLVEPDHVHEWKQVILDDQSIVWFDDAYLPDFQHENGLYPVVLIRGIEIEGNRLARSMDMKLAVDCEGLKLAPLDAWFQEAGAETGTRDSPRPVRFRPIDRFPRQLGEPAFSKACGPYAESPFAR